MSIGLTFNEGTINALPGPNAQQPATYRVAPALRGYNEHTPDRVHPHGCVLDLRTAPPAAKDRLSLARPTRSYGLYWSSQPAKTALAHAYDAVIHLHTVRAADLV
ncbi:erythromycin esterase family protein [Streptomyces sp. NPDC020917]|uniref:erythromycin esterase family protein n=1 Tax=Streptomyces sp. NPDC020917 TaxID=3365102 RepID=UPI0037B5420F